MKKKLLTVFMIISTLLLICGIINVSAATYDGWEYYVSNGEVTITDYLRNVTGLTIPSEINGYPVTSIAPSAFEYCNSFWSIEIPDSVTSIALSVFDKCSSLESITVDVNNGYYSSQDGVLFNKTKTKLIKYPKYYVQWLRIYKIIYIF